jgi:hypothetical protein
LVPAACYLLITDILGRLGTWLLPSAICYFPASLGSRGHDVDRRAQYALAGAYAQGPRPDGIDRARYELVHDDAARLRGDAAAYPCLAAIRRILDMEESRKLAKTSGGRLGLRSIDQRLLLKMSSHPWILSIAVHRRHGNLEDHYP